MGDLQKTKGNVYLVGLAEKLKQLFPNYAGHDERYSKDGRVIYELSEEQVPVGLQGVEVYTHEEILKYLEEHASDWTEAAIDAEASKKKERKKSPSVEKDKP